MSPEARWTLACLLVGLACAVLAPTTPRALIAAGILGIALGLYRPKD